MGLFDDMENFFRNAGLNETNAMVGASFCRTESFVKAMKRCRSKRAFVIDEDFMNGLDYYGYELVLRKKGENDKQK